MAATLDVVGGSRGQPTGLMRALVLTAPREFAVREVPCPRPASNEVLCRVRAIAICGTDAEIIEGTFKGRWPKAYPFIPGHEWAGEVIEAAEAPPALRLLPRARRPG